MKSMNFQIEYHSCSLKPLGLVVILPDINIPFSCYQELKDAFINQGWNSLFISLVQPVNQSITQLREELTAIIQNHQAELPSGTTNLIGIGQGLGGRLLLQNHCQWQSTWICNGTISKVELRILKMAYWLNRCVQRPSQPSKIINSIVHQSWRARLNLSDDSLDFISHRPEIVTRYAHEKSQFLAPLSLQTWKLVFSLYETDPVAQIEKIIVVGGSGAASTEMGLQIQDAAQEMLQYYAGVSYQLYPQIRQELLLENSLKQDILVHLKSLQNGVLHER